MSESGDPSMVDTLTLIKSLVADLDWIHRNLPDCNKGLDGVRDAQVTVIELLSRAKGKRL